MPPLFKCFFISLIILLTFYHVLKAESYTVDYAKAESRLPLWLQSKSDDVGSGGLATLTYVFSENTSDQDLLVTVLFQEKEGGFLRVFWDGPTAALTLVENLQEDIAMSNKRRFLLKGSLIKSGGKLVIQSGSKELPVTKIKFEELDGKTLAVSVEGKDMAAISGEGDLLTNGELSGELLMRENDDWHGNVVSAAITEKAERIEGGLLFEFSLAATPFLARLECQVNGLPMSQTLDLWLNGRGWVVC